MRLRTALYAMTFIALAVLTGCERSAPTAPSGSAADVTLIPPPSPSATGGGVSATGAPTSAATAAVTRVSQNLTPAATSAPTRIATTAATSVPTTVATAVPTVAPTIAPTTAPTPAPQPTPLPQSTPIPAPPAQAQAFPYVVQVGDTLQSIAAKFNTTVEVLRVLNNLDGDKITVGQQLIIPGTPPGNTQNKPPPQTTPQSQPTQPSQPTTPAGGVRTIRYVVKPGDRLFRIGLRFGVQWTVIARFNGITNPRLIQPGEVLLIPFDDGASAGQ